MVQMCYGTDVLSPLRLVDVSIASLFLLRPSVSSNYLARLLALHRPVRLHFFVE